MIPRTISWKQRILSYDSTNDSSGYWNHTTWFWWIVYDSSVNFSSVDKSSCDSCYDSPALENHKQQFWCPVKSPCEFNNIIPQVNFLWPFPQDPVLKDIVEIHLIGEHYFEVKEDGELLIASCHQIVNRDVYVKTREARGTITACADSGVNFSGHEVSLGLFHFILLTRFYMCRYLFFT